MTQSVRMPDGSVHLFPDQATPEQMKAALAPLRHQQMVETNKAEMSGGGSKLLGIPNTEGVPERLGAYGLNLLQAVPFSDEAISGVGAALGAGKGKDIGSRYDDLQQRQQATREAGSELNPVVTGAGQVIAGLETLPLMPMPSGAGGIVKTVAKGLGAGAGYGGLYGAGQTDSFAKDENAVLGRVGNAVTGAEIGGVLGGAIPTVAAGAKGIINARNTSRMAAKYDPLATIKDISNSYRTAVDKANTFYSFPQQLAEGKVVRAPAVKNFLNTVLDDVSNAPWHEAKSQVGTLQRISDALPDDGLVPVNDLLELRKFSNKFFNPARMTDKAAVYGQLNSAVDTGLNVAKQSIPNFGKALNLADDYWRNNVKVPFTGNKVLEKAWKPEDAHNLRMVDEGYLDEVPDLTKQRADSLVSTIKNVNAYNAIRRTLTDTGASFDAAVLQSMPSNRLASLAKTGYYAVKGDRMSAVKNAANMLGASPEETAVKSAVKNQDTYTALSSKNNLAQAAYENLMQSNMTGEGHPLQIEAPPVRPGPTKALSASAPPAPNAGPAQLTNETFNPDSRAITYQPRADYRVSSDGFAEPTPVAEVFTPSASPADTAPFAGAASKAVDRPVPARPMLTYQPRPDFTASPEMVSNRPNPQVGAEFRMGEAEGMPMAQGDMNAMRRVNRSDLAKMLEDERSADELAKLNRQ